ncbi:MAG: ATP-binding protein [Candidatus Izimaplasma sp.]|nr:ATP-binding protein [Candidatus Izimaplasma bacterium]
MKRITFLTGYYGSGKTEIAINLAIQKKVDYVVDLDIINPYFRSRELEEYLNENGIDIISSDMSSKMHLDMPYISKRIYQPINNTNKRAIYDLGGNDQGAKLLRQFDDYHDEEYDLLLVVNIFRTETDNAEKIIQLINKIEGISGFKVTGLINNSNLLKDTTLEDVLAGEKVLNIVSELLGLEILYTSIWKDVTNDENLVFSGEALKLNLYFRKNWF